MKRKTKRKLGLWLYVIVGVILLGFVAPALISAADTLAVIFGLILLVGYGLWSWELIKTVIKEIK